MDAFFRFLESPTAERIFASLAIFLVGGLLGWAGHKWRQFRLQRQVERGDARDVATIERTAPWARAARRWSALSFAK